MEKKNKSVVIKIIVAVCIVAVVAAGTILTIFFVNKFNKNQNGETENTTTDIESVVDYEKPDYSEYIEMNPETVGWISIPGTKIDYPVVQTLDNSYYMSHDFNRNSDYHGAIFMDSRNNSTDLDSNTIIYGHNSYTDGKVFTPLAQYENIDFYKEHPVIEFNTLERCYKWKNYAVIITNRQPLEDNNYVFNYVYPHIEGSNFKGYIEELNKRTLYFTGVDIKNGDKILTLQTCIRSLDITGNSKYPHDYPKSNPTTYRAEGGIIVIARAVRPGEDPTVDTSTAKINPNPKYPQIYYDKHGLVNPYKNDKKWYPTKVVK